MINNETEKAVLQPEERQAQTLQRLQQLWPDKVFSLIGTGSRAVVYQSDRLAYKVHLPSPSGDFNLPYYQDEAAILALLGQEGLAPQIKTYLEPDPSTITLPPQPILRLFTEFDHLVPKETSSNEQAVLVMDKVNFDPDGLRKMSSAQKFAELQRIKAIASKFKIEFGDNEFVYDKERHKIVIIDAGGVQKIDLDFERSNLSDGLSDQQIIDIILTQNIARHLSGRYKDINREEIAKYITTGDNIGLESYVFPASRFSGLLRRFGR